MRLVQAPFTTSHPWLVMLLWTSHPWLALRLMMKRSFQSTLKTKRRPLPRPCRSPRVNPSTRAPIRADRIVERTDGKARQSISLDVDTDGWRERKVVEYMSACERDGEPKTRDEAVADLRDEDPRFEDYE